MSLARKPPNGYALLAAALTSITAFRFDLAWLGVAAVLCRYPIAGNNLRATMFVFIECAVWNFCHRLHFICGAHFQPNHDARFFGLRAAFVVFKVENFASKLDLDIYGNLFAHGFLSPQRSGITVCVTGWRFAPTQPKLGTRQANPVHAVLARYSNGWKDSCMVIFGI